MNSKYKLNDIVRIKTLVPKFPRFQHTDTISNMLIEKVVEARVVAIDTMSWSGKTMYELDFRCFDYDHMGLTIDEERLEEMYVSS